jgi:FAD/FMN-containing dehydrogenase
MGSTFVACGVDWVERLRSIAGAENVLPHETVESRYKIDWTAGPIGDPIAVVRPRTTEQVSAILSLCHEVGQPVVTQGGRTGMVRGGVPQPGELVLSTELMNAVEAVDEAGSTLLLQAGVPLQVAQAAAADAGLSLPLDLGGRGSATIGGMIATNAGGNRVIRYGMTRDSVLGLEVVLADGSVMESLSPLVKNNAGYDLKHLFIGSEGTLGVVTRAVLRLRPPTRSQNVALCALETFEQAGTLLQFLDGVLAGQVTAFEMMWNNFYSAVTALPNAPAAPLPNTYPFYALVETLGGDPQGDGLRFRHALEQGLDRGLMVDAAVASSQRQSQEIWRLRDSIGELLRAMPAFAPFDISLPISRLPSFTVDLSRCLAERWPGRQQLFFGHLGDNNLHVVLRLDDPREVEAVEHFVYGLLHGTRNSISAEHGIGLLKRNYLDYSRSPREIELMRGLKRLLDRKNILNPGRVIEIDSAD